MRICKKGVLSIIVTFALMLGCFAGSGITVRAGILEVNISSDELEGNGGEVAVTVTGENLGDVVWWVLEKQVSVQEGNEIYETAGEDMNTADVGESGMSAEFPVQIPENEKDSKEVYRIRVSITNPYNSESGEYTWDEMDVRVSVAVKDDGMLMKAENEKKEENEHSQTAAESERTQMTAEADNVTEAQNEAAASDESADVTEVSKVSETLSKEPAMEKDMTVQGVASQSSSVPKYHNIPPYQEKNVHGGTSVKIKSLPVEEIVDGKPGGKIEPFANTIKFQIFDSTKQKTEKIVEAKNGRLPDLDLIDNHTYIITAKDKNYKVVRAETTTTKLSKNAYIWVHNGKIFDIKKNADTYDYPEFKSLQVAKKDSSDTDDDDRVLLRLPVYYKNGNGELRNVPVRLVSAVETIETTTGDNGRFRHGAAGYDIRLLEDVTYIIVVDDEKYGIESFPIAAKDKSEYRTDKGRPGERYFYDHADCHQVNEIRLVDKKDAHKNDKTITSLSGKTTISGFNFKDFLAIEKKLSKNLVTGLDGKDYDVFDISVINPHRWEISKLAAGSFKITEKIEASKKVANVYYIDNAGKLKSIGFKQDDNRVSFTMKSLSVHPVVIEYRAAVKDNHSNSSGNNSAVSGKPSGKPSGVSGKRTAVKKVTVSGDSKSIAAGKKVKLTAKVTPSNATNKAVKWTSSNKKYATVDSKGKVTLKKAGAGKTVKITAAAKDGSGKKGVYQIKIMKNAVTRISLKAPKTVKAGKKATVKATVKTNGKKANKKLKWSSSNKKYATVNSKGKVTAKKSGKGKTVKITAKATDGSGKKKTVAIKIK